MAIDVNHSTATDQAATPLSRRLAREIYLQLRDETLNTENGLSERKLAEAFKVSRSPVRTALALLVQAGVILRGAGNNYQPARPLPQSLPEEIAQGVREPWEELYYQLATDHLAGQMNEQHSENDLMRRYDQPRNVVRTALQQAADEGWIARAPGHGWLFLPVLNSPDAHQQSRAYRIIIEPQAILLPTFCPDFELFRKLKVEQSMLIDQAEDLSPAKLFNSGSRFHEAIIGCSGNMFVSDSLARVNRLRRLMEYPKIAMRADWTARCAQHITILDYLLANKLDVAAVEMHQHLSGNPPADQ